MIDEAVLAEASVKFWSKVDIRSPEDCWFRDGAISRGGYSRFNFGGKMHEGHRMAYELFVGPIPPKFQIDHLCRVRACVNPYHLDAVPQRENLIRGHGIPGANIRKTHCLRGHPLEGNNVRLRPQGDGRVWRECRTCAAEQQRVRAAREKKGSG